MKGKEKMRMLKVTAYGGDIHEMSAQFMLFLLFFLHVLGVAVSSRMQNDNLVKSVITGKKDIYI